MLATALKSAKRRFSSLNHQNFEFFLLVPRSPTHTGLICGKALEPNISSLGPFKKTQTEPDLFPLGHDKPNRLRVEGEGLPFVLHSLRELERAVESGTITKNSGNDSLD
jgi:hypothetical protein